MRGVRAVISGAGAAGLLHALAYRASGVRIAAVHDPDLERARALAELAGGAVAPTLGALVATRADVASVCGPPRVHVEQAELLSRAGAVVLVEKPVATTLPELERLAALPRCVPIVQWRAGRAIRAVRRAIQAGELGPAPVVACDLDWARDDAYLRARGEGWGCGALLSIGIHAIDAVAWALGRPIDGASGMTARRAGADGETSAVALFRFAGGASASLRLSLDGGGDATRIAFCGGGVTAYVEGGEADPTASRVRWIAGDARALRRLEALEDETPGALGPPLVVPFVGDVVAALCAGDLASVPDVKSTEGAHAAAMLVAQAVPAPLVARPFLASTSACAAASRAMVTRNGEHET